MFEIESWMRTNGYALWYKDKSGSAYVRQGAVRVTAMDRAGLLVMEARLGFTRIRKAPEEAARAAEGAVTASRFVAMVG